MRYHFLTPLRVASIMTPRTVVVFAGAGASKAVSADHYPTTVEFFSSLPQEVTSNELFKVVCAFLRKTLSDEAQIDIELLLWRLEELRAFCRAGADSSSVCGWCFEEIVFRMLSACRDAVRVSLPR